MKKMQAFLHNVALAVVCIGMLVACTSEEEENYLSSIPADAFITFKADLCQLVRKSNILDNPLVSAIWMQVEREIPESSKADIEALKENPSALGIDLERPMAIALWTTDSKKPQVMAVVAVSDKEKCDRLFNELAGKNSGINISDAGNGIRKITLADSQEVSMAYNKSRLVCAFNADAVSLTSQKASVSLLSKKNAGGFIGSRKDLAFYIDYSTLCEVLQRQSPQMTTSPLLGMMKESALFGESNFEQGRIVCDVQMYGSKELQEYGNMYHQIPTGKYLGLVPADSYLVISGACRDISKIMAKCLSGKDMQALDAQLQQNGLDRSIFDCIDGDITLGIGDHTLVPDLVLAVSCKDRSLFDAIRKLAPFPAEGDNLLKIPVVGYYIAYIDHTLLVTSQHIYNECLSSGKLGELTESFKKSSRNASLKKGGILIDFKGLADSQLWEQFNGDAQTEQMRHVLGRMGTLTAYSHDAMSGHMEITMQDQSKNALEQLIAIGLGIAMGMR